jgi:hypothetical protein
LKWLLVLNRPNLQFEKLFLLFFIKENWYRIWCKSIEIINLEIFWSLKIVKKFLKKKFPLSERTDNQRRDNKSTKKIFKRYLCTKKIKVILESRLKLFNIIILPLVWTNFLKTQKGISFRSIIISIYLIKLSIIERIKMKSFT